MTRRNVVFLMFAAYAAVYFLTMRLHWDIQASPIRGSDLSSYYTAGLLLREGRADALYAVAPGDSILGDATSGPWAEAGRAAGVPRQHYYIYPPFFALAALPLSLLPFGAAMDAWLALDLVLLGLFAYLYSRLRGSDLTLAEGCFVAVTCLFEFLPLIWAMAIGQTSLIVLVLLTGTLLAWRKDRDVAAGALLGLAAAVKLTPALLSVFFLWKGRARIALVSAAVFLAAQAVSVAALGWGPHADFYLGVVPSMSGGTCYFLNQSLGAFFNRLLTDGDVRQVDLVRSPASGALAWIAGLVLLGLSAAPLRREGRGVPLAPELQFGAVLILTLALSPISWVHHYLIALLPLYAVVGSLGRRPEVSLPRAAAAGAAWLLIARKPHADLFLHGAGRVFNSAALAGALALWALCLDALRGEGREART